MYAIKNVSYNCRDGDVNSIPSATPSIKSKNYESIYTAKYWSIK